MAGLWNWQETIQDDRRIKIIHGNAVPDLAKKICEKLQCEPAAAEVGQFSDGEVRLEIMEQVRGQHLFIVQSTCKPTNDNLMELLAIVDAAKRSAAEKIYAVIPYFGYARQDRRPGYSRVPITSRLVADMLQAAGVDYVIVVDLHAIQIQGFFNIPVINVAAGPVLTADMFNHYADDVLIVSPDVGGVARARSMAKQLNNVDLAIIDKRRPKANVSEVMNIIGEVEGRTCILVDDMVDTAGTLCKAAVALKDKGAEKVLAYCTHPVLSGNAIDNLYHSVIDELVVTDTIPLSRDAKVNLPDKIRVLSVANILAETIHRVAFNESVSKMYME